MKYVLALICLALLIVPSVAATQVDTLYEQVADVQGSTIIPVTITNTNTQGYSYSVHVEGLKDLGTYRIEPRKAFTLFPHQNIYTNVILDIKETANLGTYEIFIVVQSNTESTKVPVQLHVREALQTSDTDKLKKALEVTLILVLFVLLLVAFVFAYRKVNDDTEIIVSPLYDNSKEVLASEGITHATGKKATPVAKKRASKKRSARRARK